MPEPSYIPTEPYRELTVFEAQPVPTVVVEAQGHPMDELPALFDAVFSRLFPALAEAGVEPAGPAFSLYTRPPTDTVDIQVGVPVATGLSQALDLGDDLTAIPAELPGGSIGAISHLGGFDGLAEAWNAHMQALVAAGHHPDMPFFEVYVTEPNPEMDSADLRTDLFVTLG